MSNSNHIRGFVRNPLEMPVQRAATLGSDPGQPARESGAGRVAGSVAPPNMTTSVAEDGGTVDFFMFDTDALDDEHSVLA